MKKYFQCLGDACFALRMSNVLTVPWMLSEAANFEKKKD